MTHVLDDLEWRGLLAQYTDLGALREAFDQGPVTFYCGFDPTAPSLHFGNLVQLITMRRLQLAGHRPLVVVGGATGLIGDPSGRVSERSLNDESVVADWVQRLRNQVSRFLRFDGDEATAATIVNNLDWTGPMSVLTFLRDIGKHFSVNRMLDREAVSARLAAGGISYTEFSYQILQSLDYLELHERYGCTLQTGGSDQWGNLTAGVDLIRRVTGDRVHALGTPLITKSDGTKYGKTADGALWLDRELMSPYAFFQFFLNVEDGDASTLLRVCSLKPREEIEGLEAALTERPAAREAQRALAGEMTTLVHGEAETTRVVAASRALFGQGDMGELDVDTLSAALTEAGHVDLAPGEVSSVADLFASTGLVASKSAARRTIDEGGAYVNNVRVTDPDAVLADGDFVHGRWAVLRRGKRAVAGVRRV